MGAEVLQVVFFKFLKANGNGANGVAKKVEDMSPTEVQTEIRKKELAKERERLDDNIKKNEEAFDKAMERIRLMMPVEGAKNVGG